MVLASLMGAVRRHRSLRAWLKAIFYRLSILDPMEGEVESEHAFNTAGLLTVLLGGGLLLIFFICAVWYIVTSALNWRMASSIVVII